MLEASRRHGHYDQRWPAWSLRSTTPVGVGAVALGEGTVSAWEGEGGSVRLEQRAVPAGLSWEMFSGTFPDGKTRHYFPAVTAWTRYREGGSS
jgi:hypothetical protein